jgi:hypothetical protein
VRKVFRWAAWRIGLCTAIGVVTAVVLVTPAQAAVTMVLNPATVAGSDFSWSCVVNAGGGTTYVSGASWISVGGGDFVETPRTMVTGSANHTLSFTRDGDPNQTYQYRCKAYSTPTGGTPTVSSKLDVTTYGDTRYGAIVSVGRDPNVPDTLSGYISLYNSHRSALGNGPLGVRVYSSGAVPIPTESSPTLTDQIMDWVAANHPDESITVSFKSYDGSRLSSLLTWAQNNSVDITVIYFHEVQDDWGKNQTPGAEPSFYRNVYHQMRTVIGAHPWHAHVTLEKNLNWYWQNFKAPTQGADWHDYVELKNANGTKTDPADRVTWDAYSPLEWSTYATPAQFMQYALAVYNEAAAGWGYGEIGALPETTPADSAWVAAIQGYADAARTPALAGSTYSSMPAAQVFKYWDAFNNDGVHTYDLSQNPAAVTMYTAYMTSMPLSG